MSAVKAATKQRLVKCEISYVPFCKCSIKLITNPNTIYSHSITWQYIGFKKVISSLLYSLVKPEMTTKQFRSRPIVNRLKDGWPRNRGSIPTSGISVVFYSRAPQPMVRVHLGVRERNLGGGGAWTRPKVFDFSFKFWPLNNFVRWQVYCLRVFFFRQPVTMKLFKQICCSGRKRNYTFENFRYLGYFKRISFIRGYFTP
jgi:hypothetical protein